MKVIIAGSRDLSPTCSQIREALLETGWKVSEIVSGTARGVDKAGEVFAETEFIPVTLFPADRTRYGRKAGFIRNAEMADYADALLVFWDGNSRGTRSMISLMNGRKKPVHIKRGAARR